MHKQLGTVCVLCFFAGAGVGARGDDISAEIDDCRLLVIESEDAEPYVSFRRAFRRELDRLECGGDAGPDITRHSVENREGLARRIWRTEDISSYDAIVVQGTVAARSIRDLVDPDDGKPVFFGSVTDPVGLGLISGFDRPPSGRFTGVAYPVDIRERLRFVLDLFPEADSIGLVHTDMPQSTAYNARLREIMAETEFSDVSLHTREVPFVPGERGTARSVALARDKVAELDSKVDVFLAPNDQMGVTERFVRMVAEEASSPLIGINKSTAAGASGAVAALYPSDESAGRTLADQVLAYLSGEPFDRIFPGRPEAKTVINPDRAGEFGLDGG